jgi:6-phosphogluconolactonase
MRLKTAVDPQSAARVAAEEIAVLCRHAARQRGRALVAFSGGETPWLMLRALRSMDLPWDRTWVAQVDERIAPHGDGRRNLARLEEILVNEGPLPAAQLLAMPVEDDDLEAAAANYQRLLEQHGDRPMRIDLVQLGLGTDGHTASLVPGDPVLELRDRDVALSGEYEGLRRMTLTLPALDRARQRLWLVTGPGKAERLRDLLTGTGDAPAVRIARSDTVVVADDDALARVSGPVFE